MRAFLCLAATLVAGVGAEQHILLDSTKESMLDWFKYPKGPQSPTPGDKFYLTLTLYKLFSFQVGLRRASLISIRGSTGGATLSAMSAIPMLTTGCGRLLSRGGRLTEFT